MNHPSRGPGFGSPEIKKSPVRRLLEYALFVNILLFFPRFPPGHTSRFHTHSSGRRLCVEWNVPVTPSGGAHLNWFEMKADPTNKNNLIVCGAARNARNNAYYGVVYWSHDGGRSWKEGLIDRRSSWVSEQSCAFGLRHTAFFVSAASKVIDDVPHHNLGRTHIFVSRDAGATWVKMAETSWVDYSNSVVAGGRKPQLYVFYNRARNESGARNSGSSLGFFTVSENGREISPRGIVPGMTGKDYVGVYPSSSETLDDGSAAILYNAAMTVPQDNGRTSIEIGVVRVTSQGISKPVVIAHPVYKLDPPACPVSLSNSLAFDKTHRLLYAAYNTALPDRCAVMLVSSVDGGKNWSQPHELSDPAAPNRSMYFPTLAVNKDGVIGLLWRGKPEGSPDCWFFSTSSDGLRLDHSVSLSPCSAGDSLSGQDSGYLATVVSQPASGQSMSVRVVTLRDYLTRIGFVATPEGVFHPIWSAPGDGNSQLRTARISAGKRPRSQPPDLNSPPVLDDVTDKMTVLYGGDQRVDHETNSVILDLVFRNTSSANIRGPLYLKVENPRSDFGGIQWMNPGRSSGPDSGYFDLSSCLGRESLLPGQATSPCPLIFQFMNQKTDIASKHCLLAFAVRLYSQARP